MNLICIDEKGIVYHNLGSLYGIMGNSEDAIRYYKQSIEYKTDERKSTYFDILFSDRVFKNE